MEIEEEIRRKALYSIGAVLLFLLALVGVGVAFSDGAEFNDVGAIATVGLLVGFILLMAAVGFHLNRVE